MRDPSGSRGGTQVGHTGTAIAGFAASPHEIRGLTWEVGFLCASSARPRVARLCALQVRISCRPHLAADAAAPIVSDGPGRRRIEKCQVKGRVGAKCVGAARRGRR